VLELSYVIFVLFAEGGHMHVELEGFKSTNAEGHMQGVRALHYDQGRRRLHDKTCPALRINGDAL
jgi:hypothetical protein